MRKYVVLVVALCALMTTGFVRIGPSVIHFYRDHEVRPPELSPSGRYLSVIVQKGSRGEIRIADLSGQEPVQGIPIGTDLEILWQKWASDDRLLIGVLTMTLTKDRRYIKGLATRTLAFDRDGGNTLLLFEGERRILSRNRFTSNVSQVYAADPEHVFISLWKGNSLGLYSVNVYNGKYEKVSAGTQHTLYWIMDQSGAPQVRVDTNRRQSMLYFHRYDASGQRWVEYLRAKVNDLDEVPENLPLGPGPKRGQVYVLARPEGEDRKSVYLYDIETRLFVEKVFSHPVYDISAVAVDRINGGLMGGYFIADRFGLVTDQPEIQAMYQQINSSFGNQVNVQIIDSNRGRTRFVVLVSGPKIPGNYYVYDMPSRSMKQLNSRWPDLEPDDLGQMEVMHFKARDGLDLTAYVTHPFGREKYYSPVVVLPHGGPETRDHYDFNPMAQYLVSQGYRVLQVNFRGSSGFGAKFAEAGYREWGGKMQDDIEDAVQMLLDRQLASPHNICIVGASYGGYAALAAAQRDNGIFNCAVSIAGVSDLPDMLDYVRREDGASSLVYEYWLKSIGHPVTDKEHLIAISPARNAGRINMPVLLVHGGRDAIVPIKQSETMNEALERLNKDVTYIEISSASHRDWGFFEQIQLFEQLDRFLAKHLVGEF
ncbi:MAG: S9 family peptidase [Alphaproteobacteria bacterium]|nr:MAG: S9 family peptidase [Alphaproteobacteria bacterium]